MTNPINAAMRNILLLSSFAFCQQFYAQSKTIEVTDPRPVAKAIEQLEVIYGLPITYEDPITVNERLLEDVTEQVQRTPDPSHRVIGQKWGTISFTYKLSSSGQSLGGRTEQTRNDLDTAVSDAISSVLDGYANSGGPVTFTVTEEDGIFHVVPIDYLNQDGKREQMTPILDTRITILPKQRTRISLFQEICESLSKTTGIHIGEGAFPYNGSQAHALTTISGSDVTTRSLLSKLLAELAAPSSRDMVVDGPDGQKLIQNRVVWKGASLSWKLLYAPGWGYALNVHQVTLGGR
jgi:hypothetical protein